MATPESGLGRADAVLRRALEGVGLTLPKVLAGPAPQGATPRHVAPPFERSADKTNPMPRVTPQAPQPRPPRPLKPVQLTAARLLLQGQSVTAVASTLGVHRYTVARWKNDPRFQAELRRQVERATLHHAAQRGAALS